MKNPLLSQVLVCPTCGGSLKTGENTLTCASCGQEYPVREGILLFTPTPETLEPWERVERGPRQGTPWRRENWRWLNGLVQAAPEDALFLDVGSGHGDFQDIFNGRPYIALDIVPYPEVDIACDLTQAVPFRAGSFSVIVMMNVLEHVYEAERLLTRLAGLLKPDGEIWLAVPFLLKVHQAPYDFARYTPFALRQMAANAGLTVKDLQGFYDPVFQVNDALGNLWENALPPRTGPRGLAARLAVFLAQRAINMLGALLPKGSSMNPDKTANPAAMGYLAVLQKQV
jgi:SAM-dependent methyltransferase